MHDLGFFYLVERLAVQAQDERAQGKQVQGEQGHTAGRSAVARGLRNGWLPLALAGALAAATGVAAARARRA
ncbi:hypothetical protein GCM10010329_46430 [Streptomyces spiroverticillatus]|uniref:Uncharacterized protein n=1 Tax=Streptomyces finlayi TaxID=67296 RepID=A0A918X014_9ACTN|nr:hypothetical protein [Streptomyces finlayi]GHA18038.1 hypothetical protein GCM10010329_46430 [Streptomyces spiroverticillatus]GHC99739.1 hypothetical protein GCM10010334_43600 [Streptomyces finlayi]